MTDVTEVEAGSEVPESAKPKAPANEIAFTRHDGTQISWTFGKSGKIKKEYTVAEDKQSAMVEFFIVNGDYHVMQIPIDGELTLNLASHGAGQKVGDSASGCDPDDTSAAVERTIAQINKGIWSARRSGVSKGLNEFITAILRMRGVEDGTPEAVAIKADLGALDDDTIAVLKKDASVKATIAEIRFEKAQANAQKEADAEAEAADKAAQAGEAVEENAGDAILAGLGGS